MKTSVLLKRFAPYFRPYRGLVLLDLFCAALTTLCEIVLPLIVSYITDTGIADLAALTLPLILRLSGVYLLLRVIDAVAAYYMTSIGHGVGAKIETDMRRDLFAHLQKLSFSYYSHTKVGQIMSRISGDLFEITEFAHHCPEEFFIAGIKCVAAFAILAHRNLSLTALIFLALPFMYLFASHFNHRMQQGWRKTRVQIGELNAQVEDSLLGVRVVKSFANEAQEEEKFRRGNLRFLQLKKSIYTAMGGLNASVRAFDGMMYILVVCLGAIYMTQGRISPGAFTAYLLYVNMLLTTVRRIVEFTEQFQKGITGIERFFEVMDAPVEIQDAPDAKILENVRGEVVFDHVSFFYPDDERTSVLRDIHLRVAPGEKVALVGPSGSGKTTLCNLIPRFYETSSGRILIDGQDIRSVTQQSLRANIGMVQQDVYLFTGTVAENIAYGKPGAGRQEIIAAAKKAHAHEFIEALPQGYDTYIGERGVRLSGGQKQRLSIARVFLKNPPILIFDEATSALDNESERIVQDSLTELAKGRTTFTIAHRLTTIRNATMILVLADQGVVEQGTHQQLMALGGLYAHMYSMYAID
ncbi:MAG: ABC transporter ATP-binding protein/permease [Firmicutes bacterium]|nr:ABC transporter ATP-binding protein/permease [Bacillota bacterium]